MSGEYRAPARPSQARYAFRAVGRSLAASARSIGSSLLGVSSAIAGATAPVTGLISIAGWILLTGALASFVLAWTLGWVEFAYLACTLLAAMLIAIPFVFGRMKYRVHIELQPLRVVAGERALGRLIVENSGVKPSTPARLELPVGEGHAEFIIPSLAPGAEHEELFAVPTSRRAVITAGPAVSVRGDQLGLLRRRLRWTDPVELFVHPVTARLKPSAAGLVRDLEGEVTKTITDNDISFHALRAYEPGDALRNVHWRTSARTGQLMVRQYEETRRSQLLIAHSTELSHYPTDDEFELGVSIAASIAVQVIRDATNLSVITETMQLRTATPTTFLDDTSRVEGVQARYASLRDYVRDATRRLPAPSVVIAVVGSAMPLSELRALETIFSVDTEMLFFRTELGAPSRIAKVSGSTVVTVGSLADLPSLVRRVRP